ncbi:MAG: ABC transporter ATP-binding protein [Parasporobacterium sp.]|nr:ABC transporter ATP-binding protein [Parasporobacterium sp.]
MNLLEVKDLTIVYDTSEGTVHAVNGVSFEINNGETLGIVGETGAGKTTTARSLMRLLPEPQGIIKEGSITFDGKDVRNMSEKELRHMRGFDISMIFQDPMTALNPLLTVEDQIAESIREHTKLSKHESVIEARKMLEKVGIMAERGSEYPHQFSGGMQQRVVIAIALTCNPKLLIADEPTSALDVTIQAQVLKMIADLQQESGTAMILITHDLGVVAETCDKVAIMYAGEIVEYGKAEDVYGRILHPYTQGLFDSLPSLDKNVRRLKPIKGLMPDPTDLPKGCKFCPRCEFASEKCKETEPPLKELTPGHFVRCLRYEKESGVS